MLQITVSDSREVRISHSQISLMMIMVIIIIITSQGLEFLSDLRRRISQVSDGVRDSAFLFQHLLVLSQIYLTRSLFRTLFAHTPAEDEF